jgi:hypothetical protein
VTTASVTYWGSTVPFPIVLATCRPKKRKATKLKKAGPRHRRARGEHARRHDRRDRVGRVVESVDEVERERETDDRARDPGFRHS